MSTFKILSIFLPVCFVCSTCGIKTKFNKYELKWLNVYKTGDTLIFRSTNGELDTSLIVKRDIKSYATEKNRKTNRETFVMIHKMKMILNRWNDHINVGIP